VWACRVNGTASAASPCNPESAPSSPSTICGAGQDCETTDDGGVGCLPLCNPLTSSGCAAGQGCEASDLGGDPTAGFCAPVGDGGCGLVDPTTTEGSACFNAVGCGCPQICVGPDGGAVCEYPCKTTSDCLNPTEICVGGGCAFNSCGPGGAPDGGDLGPANGPCNVTGTGDGTCFGQVLETPFGNFVDYGCIAAGTSTTTCDPAATRAQPGALCQQGYGCFAGVDAGSCVPLCNSTQLTSGLGCGDAGLACYEYASILAGDTAAGECVPQGDGGCFDVPPSNTELGGCNTSADCACPQSCVTDPNFGQTCETPCQATSDCPTAYTSCQSNLCQYDYCAASPNGSAPGQYDGPCNAAGTNDGTCLPYEYQPNSTDIVPIGLCSQAGDAGTGAACTEARGAPLCAVGGICLEEPNGNSACFVTCNPTLDAGVCGGSPNACLSFDQSNAAAGYCGPCVATAGSCLANTDCCSASCDTANTGTCN
jgi:hypothetical protein